ncbi:hypothetical protein DF186_17505, partial [Enterococcus hirae]
APAHGEKRGPASHQAVPHVLAGLRGRLRRAVQPDPQSRDPRPAENADASAAPGADRRPRVAPAGSQA